jgi:hypothetical protein
VIVIEPLSQMMLAAVNGAFIFGFSVGARNDDPLFVSLLFVDDTHIFCGVAPNDCRYLRCVLLSFEATSGLKINLAKSKLVLVSIVLNVNGLACILGCRVSSLPF